MAARRRLVLASQPLYAGVPHHVLDLVECADPDDWAIDVACPRESTLWPALAGRAGIRLHPLGAARRPSPGDAASLARLARLVARADVVHVHSAKAGFLGRVAAALRGRTQHCAYTPHGWSFWAASGAEAALYRRLERRAAHWCRAIVAVSADERDAGLAAGVGRPEQYRLIPNGVDVERFGEAHEPVPGRVLFLGRLGPPKRADLALRALARVPGAELEVANDGPDRAELERLASELGVVDRVRFLGFRNDVPALLARASCLLVTSDYEAASLVVPEAMAAGVPVVATRAGGVEEVLGGGGVVVERGDVEGVASALARVLGDGDEAARLGAAGRARARGEFTRERMVASTVALWEELAGG
ncbi:MAG TPA: glycosyltransferase [Gaiellaceae bacterium]|nr:glycosyltransferase [Gaiellaceae bacterium]